MAVNSTDLANGAAPKTTGTENRATESDPTILQVAAELGSLLENHVELLDEDSHGGWSKVDETRVSSAETMIDRAGIAAEERAKHTDSRSESK